MLREGNVTTDKLNMNLQLLAGEGEGEPSDTPLETEDKGQEQDAPAKKDKDGKLYTEDEINKIIEKRLAREKKKAEQEKKEAEKLASMSEAEKQKALFEKERAEFEKEKAEFEAQKLLNETMKQLSAKGLSIEFAELLATGDAESTLENINKFEVNFNKAVEARVTERLKGNVPKAPSTAQTGEMTKEQFKKLNILQKQALLRDKPDLFKELSKK